MNLGRLPLLLAFIFSLGLHGALLLGLPKQEKPAAPPPPALSATLKPPPATPPAPLPELKLDAPKPLPEPPSPPATATPPKPAKPAPKQVLRAPQGPAFGTLPATAAQEARKQLSRMAAQDDFYPLEAIQRGWQGEVLVQIFLDPNGHVIAARVATSSGHPSLDQAALKAARALRSLPASGLEEAFLPVRFRLQ